MADYISNCFNWAYRQLPPLTGHRGPSEVREVIVKEIHNMATPRASRFIVRVAGLSGALAVCMGAYGAHGFKSSDAADRLKMTYETGSRYHLLHSVALLACPLTRRPMLVGTLLTAGMVLFCGSCYYHALTENQKIRQVTPYGGMLLIAGWIAMVL